MECLNFIATFNDKIKGTVRFHQCSPGNQTIVLFDLKGLKPNSINACHIHEFGDLTNGCMSLGSHLNLTNTDHGSILIDINDSHTGDLINNIHSDKNGKFKYSYEDPRLMLFGDVDNSIIGCSVVIHDLKDDLGLGKNLESKKTGNAGGRMTCAIIGKSKNGKIL
jgi:Cu-Zn family superoxide dismutase